MAGTRTKGGRVQGPICLTRDIGVLERIGYVQDAWNRASVRYALDAVIKYTGEDFAFLIKAFIPSMITAAAIVVATTLAGAGIGAVLGAGAPGAVLGAGIGFKVGMAILTLLGLAFLAEYLLEHMGPMIQHLQNGTRLAWDSCGGWDEIDQAAREFAEAIGIFCSLLIQAILVYITRRGMKGLRETTLFKKCPSLEGWLQENYVRLCFKYKIKSAIVVLPGGRITSGKFTESLGFSRVLLGEMMSGNAPRFRTFKELHAYLRGKGLRVVKKEVYGPKDPANPKGVKQDAAQVIYSNGDGTVIVKVKTRGYDFGARPGGTMSIEITNGGFEWADTLCKVDRNGKIIAKTLLGKEDVVVLKDGVYAITPGAKAKLSAGTPMEDLSKGGFGKDLRQVVQFEVMEGGAAKPANKMDFVNQGHIDFQDFDPTGAWEELGL